MKKNALIEFHDPVLTLKENSEKNKTKQNSVPRSKKLNMTEEEEEEVDLKSSIII